MARRKKIPGPNEIDPGMSLFYPQDPAVTLCPRRSRLPLQRDSGRSSDFPPPSTAFPSPPHCRVGWQWHKMLRELPFPLNAKEQGEGHSGGPVPFLRRSPLSPRRAPELVYEHREGGL